LFCLAVYGWRRLESVACVKYAAKFRRPRLGHFLREEPVSCGRACQSPRCLITRCHAATTRRARPARPVRDVAEYASIEIKRAAYGSASVVWLVPPVAFPLGPNPLAARGLAAVLARAGPAKSGYHTRLRLPPITQCSVAVCDDASKGCRSAGRRLHFIGRGSSMPRRRSQGRSLKRDGDKCVGLTTIGGGLSTPGARQPARAHPAHPGRGRGCWPRSGCWGGPRPGRGDSG
jgi:hypothetical protein